MGNENQDQAGEGTTASALEVAQTQDGGVVFKRGDKELTLKDIEQALDKEKNLEAGYTKKYQEIAKMRDELKAKFSEYEELDGALGESPELKAKIEQIFTEFKTAKTGGGNNGGGGKDDPASKIMAEVQALKAEREAEKQQAKMQQIINYYDGEMAKTFSDLKVTDPEMQKDIKDLAWNQIAASQGKMELDALKQFIATKAKKYLGDVKLAGARTDTTPVGTKGGGGGRTQGDPQSPKYKTKEFKQHARSVVANIFAKHKNKDGG